MINSSLREPTLQCLALAPSSRHEHLATPHYVKLSVEC